MEKTTYRFLCSLLLTKCYSGDQIKKTGMSRACNVCGEEKDAYRVLVGKPEERRPLGKLRRIWENNIKMYLREVGWEGKDRIDLA